MSGPCSWPTCGCDDPCGELIAETPAQLLARVNNHPAGGTVSSVHLPELGDTDD